MLSLPAPQQLTLDGRDPRVRTYVQTAYGPDWWAARCVACGEPLTKYAFTEQDAHDEAVHALDEPGHFQHVCKPRPVREATLPSKEKD